MGQKRGRTNPERARERAAWEAEHGDGQAEREWFGREMLPKLADVPLSGIAEAAAVSLRYASLIRSGQVVPHPVHYAALALLVGVGLTATLS